MRRLAAWNVLPVADRARGEQVDVGRPPAPEPSAQRRPATSQGSRHKGDLGLDTSRVHVIERLTAQPERIEELRRALQQAAAYTRDIPGVRQLELLQSRQNPADFSFFLIVDDLQQTDETLNQA